jgi:hypothetical protein
MSQRRSLALGLAVTAALVLVHVAWRIARPESMDDAYMFVRYAKEFLDGHGHAWNPDGQQVFGLTGSLHFLMVLALVALLPWSDDRIVTTASLLWGVLAFAALAWVVVSAASGRLRERRAWLVGGLALALLPQTLFITQALNGMDALASFMANALVAGAALWLARTGSTRALVAAIAAGGLRCARPDNGSTVACGLAVCSATRAAHPPRREAAGGARAHARARRQRENAVSAIRYASSTPNAAATTRATPRHLWNPFGISRVWRVPFLLVVVIGASRRRGRLVARLRRSRSRSASTCRGQIMGGRRATTCRRSRRDPRRGGGDRRSRRSAGRLAQAAHALRAALLALCSRSRPTPLRRRARVRAGARAAGHASRRAATSAPRPGGCPTSTISR